jgi:hypothetical protein
MVLRLMSQSQGSMLLVRTAAAFVCIAYLESHFVWNTSLAIEIAVTALGQPE